MKYWWPLRIGKFLLFAAFLIFAVGYVVMGLWNALIPELFKGPVLTYWQAIGLLLLTHFLFHGSGRWRHSNGWRHHRWKHGLEEKLAAMTPEEREQYKAEWKRRCGWYPGEESEQKQSTGA